MSRSSRGGNGRGQFHQLNSPAAVYSPTGAEVGHPAHIPVKYAYSTTLFTSRHILFSVYSTPGTEQTGRRLLPSGGDRTNFCFRAGSSRTNVCPGVVLLQIRDQCRQTGAGGGGTRPLPGPARRRLHYIYGPFRERRPRQLSTGKAAAESMSLYRCDEWETGGGGGDIQ